MCCILIGLGLDSGLIRVRVISVDFDMINHLGHINVRSSSFGFGSQSDCLFELSMFGFESKSSFLICGVGTNMDQMVEVASIC